MLLILGSASPRRLELLSQIGLIPSEVVAADIDETPLKAELPRLYARRMAEAKGRAVYEGEDGGDVGKIILTADTVVACGRRILGKAGDIKEAERFLRLLSGRAHRVYGGLCLTMPDGSQRSRIVETRVKFKRLSDKEISDYLASNEWQDKAGAYAIQGLAAVFVKAVQGSYSNIVGLSLHDTYVMLDGAGFGFKNMGSVGNKADA